jgi:glutathione synthase/RimK-type ligase-like ATP-grasp enzyme
MADRWRVLQLIGIDDSRTITVTYLSQRRDRMRFDCLGNVELSSLVDPTRFELVPFLCGPVKGEPVRVQCDVILNVICDPDTNAGALGIARRICNQLGVGVINHPDRVLASSRDDVAVALADLPAALVPRTVRITPTSVADVAKQVAAAGLGTPFLFREAGAHGGRGLVLVRGRKDASELERFAFDGRHFYVSEFVDYRSPDGRYRKYRALVVGGYTHAKHMIAAEGWNIHAGQRAEMEKDAALVAEEEKVLVDGLSDDLRMTFTTIHERLGLDYFGIDYGLLDDGRPVLFEVNACVRALAAGATTSAVASHAESTRRIRDDLGFLLASRATSLGRGAAPS